MTHCFIKKAVRHMKKRLPGHSHKNALKFSAASIGVALVAAAAVAIFKMGRSDFEMDYPFARD